MTIMNRCINNFYVFQERSGVHSFCFNIISWDVYFENGENDFSSKVRQAERFVSSDLGLSFLDSLLMSIIN